MVRCHSGGPKGCDLMKKIVRYGHPKYGVPMYIIEMIEKDNKYIVEVNPCDMCGNRLSDLIIQKDFNKKFLAKLFVFYEYKKFYTKVNERY